MRPTLLLVEADSKTLGLPLEHFRIRRSTGVATAWEEQFADPADVVLLGAGIRRDTAMTFVERLRGQFPTTIGVVASGDGAIDIQTLQLALEHADAIAELRRRSRTPEVARFA